MKKTIRELKLTNKKVVLRLDLNVPLDKKGEITDNKRIVSSLETINYLVEKKARIIIISHLGRPEKKYNKKLSLGVVVNELKKLLNMDVKFVPSKNVIDDLVVSAVDSLKGGEIIVLENIRFRKEEEENDDAFSEKLASLGDYFVFDAFGTAHRKHASTYGISKYLPSAIGFLVEKEIKYLGKALEKPRRPFTVILGGAKVSDKIKIINSFLDKANAIIIGGGMAYTFLKAKGYEVGTSLVDKELIPMAKQIITDANDKNVLLLLPKDVKASVALNSDGVTSIFDIEKIPSNYMGLDIGPKTIEYYTETIKNSNTIFMNGPLGVFELEKYREGTLKILEAMSENKETTIVGGGDSATAANKFGLADKVTFVSTGGGASLLFLENSTLPALEMISDK